MIDVRDGLLSDDDALLASTCDACGRPEFPARTSCPACGGVATVAPLPRGATLVGHSAVLHAPPGAKLTAPYPVGVAQFPNGLAVMGLLVGAVDDAAIGVPVETVAHEPYEGARTFAFRI